MTIGKVHSWKKIIAQEILLAIPTVVLACYLLWNMNRFYDILQNEWLKQGSYFAAGIVSALLFYFFLFTISRTKYLATLQLASLTLFLLRWNFFCLPFCFLRGGSPVMAFHVRVTILFFGRHCCCVYK